MSTFKKDLQSLTTVLNSSGFQKREPTVYQVLSTLIKSLVEFDSRYIAITIPDLGQVRFPSPANYSVDKNILDSYEEGLWLPGDGSKSGLNITNSYNNFTKIGRLTIASANFVYPVTASIAAAKISGLPVVALGQGNVIIGFNPTGIPIHGLVAANTNVIEFYDNTGVAITNAQLSAKSILLAAVYVADR